jgi:glycine C-acetyltransferase
VPRGSARIRTQMAAHFTEEQIDRAIGAFAQAGRKLEII